MARRSKDGPIKSKISSKNRSDGKLRYETTVPVPVAVIKGKWEIEISKDNKITWKQIIE